RSSSACSSHSTEGLRRLDPAEPRVYGPVSSERVQLMDACCGDAFLFLHVSVRIVFGAACTLSHMGAVLRKAVQSLPPHQTEVFQAVLEQLQWFAGQQIRNVAVNGSREVLMDDSFFTGYRKTAVEPQEILLSIHIPYSQKVGFISAFKQSPRREDDISIVTAAMSVTFSPGTDVVKDLRLSFGGMAPVTVLARRTADRLLGRQWGEELLQEACSLLAEEMSLDPSAPGGMVSYRRTLTLSLFYKFYLRVLQKLRLQVWSQRAGGESTRYSKHTSTRETDTLDVQERNSLLRLQAVPEGQSLGDVVGRPIMHLSALKQATGEAMYCDDVPLYENELYLALITSTKAHARILSVDAAAAERSPGVVCCLFASDVPGSNITGMRQDETVFADGQVTCVGHIVGAVVADTQLHAQRAAKAVKIQYEELEPVVTIQEAIVAQSFYKPIRTIQCGDLEAGFKQIHIGGQEHFYLETNVTLAVPREDGEMELFISSQSPSDSQVTGKSPKALGVPANRVLVRVKRMGGGFGGKESRTSVLSTVVAVAADKLKRPVRCMLDRDEDMLITGGRHPFYGKYKVGFLQTGKVVALDVTFYSNAGNSMDLSQIMERALFHMENSYSIPNVHGQGFICRTNLPSNTAFRGFGGPQGLMVAEAWITDVAHCLGLCLFILQVRRLNLYLEGESTPYNQILHGVTLDRCWDECLSRSEYERRRAAADLFNRQNRWTKRGLAVVPTKFGIAFTATFLNQAGALVHIYRDGSVLLTHGGTEMGQGLHTKMVQVASRVLGIPCARIYVSETSTNTVANTSPTAASASSDLNGAAVLNACQTLLKRLEPYRTQNPKGSWEDWVMAAYLDRVNLSANGFYRTPDLGYDFDTNSGRVFNYYSYGVACSEVEIDCLTGTHKNLSTTIVMDVGHSLNPAIDVGQVEGGFMQGLGLFTLEELHYSPRGVLLTRGPGSYKIPAFGDIPTQLTVSLLRDAPNDKAIFASKAVGEPPLFLASSVFYAIKDAVRAARAESGMTGPFRLDSPASAERIRTACCDRFTKLCPPAQPGTFSPWSVRV
uniref:Xanthine dehydrogenase n=1 Tax=Fundulus heteroclitus TaxID=8078 RepID=A0A3Q2Q718_FUNHE